MRRLLVLVAVTVAALGSTVFWGCAQDPMPMNDDCDKARAVFTRCGVSVPILTDGACTGAARVVARCVANHASTCDELSTLLGRIDACAADELDGGDLAPVTDLPLPPPADAGTDADVTPLPPIDAATQDDAATDAAPSVDAGDAAFFE